MLLMKKFGRVVASAVLRFSLVGLALSVALATTFGSPDFVKSTVGESGLYGEFVDGLVDQFEQDMNQRPEAGAAQEQVIDPERLRTAAQTALPADLLQSSTETFVDSIYSWLQGETANPEFQIDLTEPKARFITTAGQMAEDHVGGLPICTTAQLRELNPETDAFSLTCRPPQLNPAAARQEFETELSRQGFLQDPVINSDNFRAEDGTSSFDNLSGAPASYRLGRIMPWIFGATTLLAAAGVVLLSQTKRQGIKSLGFSLLGTGVILAITSWLFDFLLGQALGPNGPIGQSINNNLQRSAADIAEKLSSAYNGTLLTYGLVYAGLGLIVVLAIRFLWQSQPAAISNPAAPEPRLAGHQSLDTPAELKETRASEPPQKQS